MSGQQLEAGSAAQTVGSLVYHKIPTLKETLETVTSKISIKVIFKFGLCEFTPEG